MQQLRRNQDNARDDDRRESGEKIAIINVIAIVQLAKLLKRRIISNENKQARASACYKSHTEPWNEWLAVC